MVIACGRHLLDCQHAGPAGEEDGRGSVRWLVFAAALALLVIPALTPYAQAESERAKRLVRQKASGHQFRVSRLLCPPRQLRRRHLGQRRRPAQIPPRILLGSIAKPSAKAHPQSRAHPRAFAATYAVQFKTGLSSAERQAAIATLRDKYKLKIIKLNKALDILRVAPRSELGGKPPKSLGAALTPKVIQDLRKEPFVDAAYVDFPVAPPVSPKVKSGN
jgi:hypothetical protein